MKPVSLLYFNLRARGEPLKMMLIHSGMDWENRLVSFEEWGKLKGTMPNKQVPVLELQSGDDTQLIPESLAIAKWIAERCTPSLVPSTPELEAKADRIFMLCDTDFGSLGMSNPLLNFFSVEEASKRLPEFLSKVPDMYQRLAEELGEGPYFCGKDISYADFNIFHYMNNICTMDGGHSFTQMKDASASDRLKQWYNGMKDVECVKQHLKDRPQTGKQQVGSAASIVYNIQNPPEEVAAIKDFIGSKP